MSKQPPRKIKVLTRLRIDEVSAVDKGAGEGVKVVLMKRRDDSTEPAPLTNAERARAQLEGRMALRHQEEIEARNKRDRDDERFNFLLGIFKGDIDVVEAFGGKNDDAEPTSTHKSHTEATPMPVNLSDVVKAHGVVALCKYMVESQSSFGATESELVELATLDAHRKYPTDTPAGAFAKLYMESRELQQAVEIAKGSALKNAVADAVAQDSEAACAELTAIGKARWPSLSPAQRFARAFETNPTLAARAHRRPGPSTSFPHPVAKAVPLTNVDGVTLTPQSVTETDPNSAEKALAQLKALGRQKWPTLSEAQAFLNAVTDPENAPLVRAALHVPTGSSPARQ